VCFFSHERWPRAEVGRKLPPVPPNLVVEVFSPGNPRGKVLEKLAEYLSAGISLVWIVYPKSRSVSIYRTDDEAPVVLKEEDVIENLPELPGFRCPVADLFL
jgi:Uma2 family endonuclease